MSGGIYEFNGQQFYGDGREVSPTRSLDSLEREARPWPADFSHENGNYECICAVCKLTFVGHKRRVICRKCANSQLPE